MKLERIEVGATVYDVGRRKMGNTTMKTVCVWPVRVIEVDLTARTVKAAWNFNPARIYTEREFSKWRAEKPMLVGSITGKKRLATAEERKAAREKIDRARL